MSFLFRHGDIFTIKTCCCLFFRARDKKNNYNIFSVCHFIEGKRKTMLQNILRVF